MGMSVHLSVHEHILETTYASLIKFSLHVNLRSWFGAFLAVLQCVMFFQFWDYFHILWTQWQHVATTAASLTTLNVCAAWYWLHPLIDNSWLSRCQYLTSPLCKGCHGRVCDV